VKNCLLNFFLCASLAAQISPTSAVQQNLKLIKDWLRDTTRVREQMDGRTPHILDQIFNWQEIGHRALENNWVNLSTTWQSRLTEAIRKKIIREASEFLLSGQYRISEKDIRWADETIKELTANVTADIIRQAELEHVSFRMNEDDMSWKIYDIRGESFRLIGDHLSAYDNLLNEGYSNDYVEAVILNAPQLVLDDFSSNTAGDFPKSWGWRKKDDTRMHEQDRIYSVEKEADNFFLAGRITGSSLYLVRPCNFNIKEYSYLSWKWRLRSKTPAGGRVAAVTVIFYQNWIGIPITISYLWSGSTSPCNIISEQNWFYDSHSIVLESSVKNANRWIEEIVHPYEDYKKIFGENPPDQCVGISVVMESDGTEVRCDFDDLVLKTSADTLSCSNLE